MITLYSPPPNSVLVGIWGRPGGGCDKLYKKLIPGTLSSLLGGLHTCARNIHGASNSYVNVVVSVFPGTARHYSPRSVAEWEGKCRGTISFRSAIHSIGDSSSAL